MKLAAFLVVACLSGLGFGGEEEHGHHHSGHKKHHHCNHLPPGLTQMAKGVDLTKLDLFPADLNSDFGFKETLIEFTCKEGDKWTHPSTNTVYDHPDQILSIGSLPAGQQSVTAEIHKSLSDYQRSMAKKVGVSVSFIGSFSASASYSAAKRNIMKTHKQVAQTSCSRSSEVIEFRELTSLRLSRKFRKAISSLKIPFAKHTEAYASFFDDFGSHFFIKGYLGGVLYQKTTMDSSYIESKKEHEVKTALKSSFPGFGGSENSLNLNYKKNMEDFSQHSESSIFYYGGASNLAKKDSLTQWWATVDKTPWLFGGKLKPIYELIANETVQDEVKLAGLWTSAKVALADVDDSIQLSGHKLNFTLWGEDFEKQYTKTHKFAKSPLLKLKPVQEHVKDIASLHTMVEVIVKKLENMKLEKLKNIMKEAQEIKEINCTELHPTGILAGVQCEVKKVEDMRKLQNLLKQLK